MKLSARAVELNCLFLMVVALLVALQLFLQRAQQHLQVAEREAGVAEALLGNPPDSALGSAHSDGRGSPGSGQDVVAGASEESLAAAPFVPNIRKSFPKRKAPYVRKGKNKKKKTSRGKNKKQQKHGGRSGGVKEGEQNANLHQGGKAAALKKAVGPNKGGGKTGAKFGGKQGAPKAGGKPAPNKQAKATGSNR